ncbi:unnamed protein product [Spirodela intermedia]|uniref:Uncharacterized protein n=1 Tax=Spirodela intermedia TaxID=51605 RepID=A0A7I8KDA7_SPIIN|nr:unnamed protein product [Spirodela intermedia]
MASQGKFVSVNLNKSYGRPSSSSGYASSPSNSYGNAPRPRSGGGGGGGMVVLSRPRSSVSTGQKGGPRLSVPPPLNLPSLRKEHERFDLSAATGRSAGSGSTGLGQGHGAQAMGWTRTSVQPPSALHEDGAAADRDHLGKSGAGNQAVQAIYVTPSSQSGGHPLSAAAREPPTAESALALRGEDFPSLLATFEASKKRKDGTSQKLKQKVESEEPVDLQAGKSSIRSPLYGRPQIQASRFNDYKGSNSDVGTGRPSTGQESSQKRGLPGPLSLPLVHMTRTSDWADDERDTGLGIPERDRERGFPRAEPGHFDVVLEGQGPRHSERVFAPSRELFRGDSYGRDSAAPNRDGRDASSWRTFPHSREGLAPREPVSDRGGIGSRTVGVNREMSKEATKYGQSPHQENGYQDSWLNRREMGAGHNSQTGRTGAEPLSGRDGDQKMADRYSDIHVNRNRGNVLQNIPASRTPFSSGNKVHPTNDPVMNFARDRRSFSNSSKPYSDDAIFDSSGPFLGGLSGDINMKIFKRKKDATKQVDFHDPVRESFEAELQRVQQLQEMERQRVLEEQTRALELARKEEEERERFAREEEEQRRKLEEEAREAAWRAEQERLEASRKAEEQKIAREEEKRRILMEEERRKEAAREKLLELEARIAKRQAETTVKDDRNPSVSSDEGMPRMVKEKNDKDARWVADVGVSEDGERLEENNAGTSDSANINRLFEPGSRTQLSRDGNPSFKEKGKLSNPWRKDANMNSSTISTHDQDSGFRNLQRDAFGAGKAFPRKEFSGSPSSVSARPSSKGGISENVNLLDDSRHSRDYRWNITSETGDHFNKISDMDAEFLDNDGDVGWRQNRSSDGLHSAYSTFQNADVDGVSSFGRSRYSLRQPRVLPPPFSSTQRRPFRVAPEHPSSSAVPKSEAKYQSREGDDEIMQIGYGNQNRDQVQQPVTTIPSEELEISLEKNEKTSPRCASQSSLSVTSPPSSPTHLSHDDLDDSGDSPSMPASAHGERLAFSDGEHAATEIEAGVATLKMSPSSISLGEDEWEIENGRAMEDQEEYDEDIGYHEEDEAHDGDDENLVLVEEYGKLHADIQSATDHIDQLTISYDEDLEVKIPSSNEIESAGTSKKETGRQPETHELIGHHETHVQALNALAEVRESSSKNMADAEKVMNDLGVEHLTSVGYSVENTPTISSFKSSLPPSSAQPGISSVSTLPPPTEVPLKLQFGLFSGPSLIPPPVPAIQIGSIQMPLHLHPPVAPSLAQVHSPQSTFFQFGQMRYPSIPQGLLPLAPQGMPFVHPTLPTHYSLTQSRGGSLHNQMAQDSSVQNVQSKDDRTSGQTNNQPSLASSIYDNLREKIPAAELTGSSDISRNEEGPVENSTFRESQNNHELVSQTEQMGSQDVSSVKDQQVPVNNTESQRQMQGRHASFRLFSEENVSKGARFLNTSGGRGRRYVYKVKNSSSRSLLPAPEYFPPESNDSQRKSLRNIRRSDLRAREGGRRQIEALESGNFTVQNEKPTFNGRATIPLKGGLKRDTFVNKPNKTMADSGKPISGSSGSRAVSEGRTVKTLSKELSSRRNISIVDGLQPANGSLKRSVSLEEDIDSPLQSGIIRIFKQPGIEIPSDEDDFIEVRSKRQMLNDRREQREKQNKAKSKPVKMTRKPRPVAQTNHTLSYSNKTGLSSGVVARGAGPVSPATNATDFVDREISAVSTAHGTSQPLAPIGTPAVSTDADIRSRSTKTTQSAPAPAFDSRGSKLTSGLSFENNMTIDDIPTSLGPWNNAHMNQQVNVMTLTHSQVDEAMKPSRFDGHVTSIGDHHGIVIEPEKLSTSTKPQDKTYSSSASSLSSVFPGERIQFGAVTSPTILPPVSRAVSRMSAPDKESAMFFEKEKRCDEPSIHLDDPEAEAEAEAAASAVAVAAISSDEVVGNGLGAHAAVSHAQNFEGSSPHEGVRFIFHEAGGSRSAAEESLTVALPADLSVETPALSLWPPLPSPQSSSGPMISCFPGAPPSHFPCFEMNPIIGGPIFAFGPNDESAGTQTQLQRSTAALSAWPACHSGVDSFYGPPAGFTGPFISPPVGIPGVQGPPHMVVYNHFTPVGQFGQLGLGFMGATYIPSGKQPDWKHNSAAGNASVSEGIAGNINGVSSGQRVGAPGMASPIQHLTPGSPLMPMGSPLTMFDMSPFQPSADMPVQARWSHLPAPPLHSVPLSVPLQQYPVDQAAAAQFSHGMPPNLSAADGRFSHEPRSSRPMDQSMNFSAAVAAAAAAAADPRFPDELGLVETPQTIGSSSQVSHHGTYAPPSRNNGKGPGGQRSLARDSAAGNVGSTMKPQAFQPLPPPLAAQQYIQGIGYGDQKVSGLPSQKVGSGGEWYRRQGLHQGKNQPSGTEKSFIPAKVKQIYVAKPASGGPTASS